jgi:hypothetical protein
MEFEVHTSRGVVPKTQLRIATIILEKLVVQVWV